MSHSIPLGEDAHTEPRQKPFSTQCTIHVSASSLHRFRRAFDPSYRPEEHIRKRGSGITASSSLGIHETEAPNNSYYWWTRFREKLDQLADAREVIATQERKLADMEARHAVELRHEYNRGASDALEEDDEEETPILNQFFDVMLNRIDQVGLPTSHSLQDLVEHLCEEVSDNGTKADVADRAADVALAAMDLADKYRQHIRPRRPRKQTYGRIVKMTIGGVIVPLEGLTDLTLDTTQPLGSMCETVSGDAYTKGGISDE